MLENIKQLWGDFLQNDRLFFPILLIFVALCAFGLGRLAERTIAPTQLSEAVSMETSVVSSTKDETSIALEEETVVASKNGTKYHFPWCPGASQMKEENKVYFANRTDAEAAGYTPAANCKGL